MKRMMSIAAIALFVAGSSALACETCGCKAKKADAKPACSSCKTEEACKACTAKKAEKKCAEGCTKECCAPKAEAKK
jgi:hypothetical protein